MSSGIYKIVNKINESCYIGSTYSQDKLAEEYGVSRTTIQQIIENKVWKEVEQ